jgi:hypothetical protein
MNVLEQIAQLSQVLPPEKQAEVGVCSRLTMPPERALGV